MNPLEFAGIKWAPNCGDRAADAEQLLLSRGKAATWRHVQAVAGQCEALAMRFGQPTEDCRLAGILHDISAVIPAEEMLRYARAQAMPLDPAEINHPFLLHQRISAIVARECFGVTSEAVLNAIACHTTLRPHASDMDMILFLADKIAWDQPGEPPFLAVIADALKGSLRHACRVYIDYGMENGMILQPHADWLAAWEWLRKEDA